MAVESTQHTITYIPNYSCGYDGCLNWQGQPYGPYSSMQKVREHSVALRCGKKVRVQLRLAAREKKDIDTAHR